MSVEILPEFASFKLNPAGIARVDLVRLAFSSLLLTLQAACPEGRHFSVTKTKLEEACFFAVKSICVDPDYQFHEEADHV
jgi:hypothetical protein